MSMKLLSTKYRDHRNKPLFIDPDPNPVTTKITWHRSSFNNNHCCYILVFLLDRCACFHSIYSHKFWPRFLTFTRATIHRRHHFHPRRQINLISTILRSIYLL
ncbi:hypothetical protein Leryth_026053 [Lithospermum erythrorhizon]|nr:hypothetical protein Leryth_026053 [Lithospermum erythrorhizon]